MERSGKEGMAEEVEEEKRRRGREEEMAEGVSGRRGREEG